MLLISKSSFLEWYQTSVYVWFFLQNSVQAEWTPKMIHAVSFQSKSSNFFISLELIFSIVYNYICCSVQIATSAVAICGQVRCLWSAFLRFPIYFSSFFVAVHLLPFSRVYESFSLDFYLSLIRMSCAGWS